MMIMIKMMMMMMTMIIIANVENFLRAASAEIPSLVGVKFSSKDLVDMLGCVHVVAPNRDDKRYNMVFGTDEVMPNVKLLK